METIRIFVSYAREDKRWFEPDHPFGLIPWLEDSLRKQQVVFWHDKNLILGSFTSRILEEIDKAQIAVLLVSQAFLNSKYIEEKELPRIKARKGQGHLEVVPILVGSCGWDEDDFLHDFQILPGKPTPLIDYTESEARWDKVRFEILDGLKKLVKRIRATIPEPSSTASRVSPPVSIETTPALNESADVKKYRKAADQGHAAAQFNLDGCYANGTGVAKNEAEAVKWYRKSAEQGHTLAVNALTKLSA
jgi:hypothetical protein